MAIPLKLHTLITVSGKSASFDTWIPKLSSHTPRERKEITHIFKL